MVIFDNIIKAIQSYGGVSVYFNNLIQNMEINGIPFEIVESNKKNFLSKLERYKDCDIDNRKGVFHSTYYRLPLERKNPVVTTVHDFTYEKFIKGPAKWVHSWQKNRAIRGSDEVICVSHNTAKDLLKYCPIDESKINVIYNGVSDFYYPLSNHNVTEQVVFVGARSGYKNFEFAARAVAKIKKLELTIVGGGNLTTVELNLLDALLPNRYKWLGKISDEELNIVYNNSYALLYPSSYEGFGIPVIEAMKAGCPVIAINQSSIPEIAGNAAILVDEAKVELLTDALVTVDCERNKLIDAGFIQARNFSWKKCFDETLKVYQKLS